MIYISVNTKGINEEYMKSSQSLIVSLLVWLVSCSLRVKNVVTSREFKWGLSVNKWCDVKCSDVEWTGLIYVKLFYFDMKLYELLWIFGTIVLCTLGWHYTEGTWFYCAYFIWCVSCAVFAVTYCVMCVCVCVCGGFIMCGCFINMCTCI
jgi:hypothetical protein